MDNLSLPLPEPYARSIADEWEIPKALAELPRWLVWRAKPRGNSKIDKIPVSPLTGSPCNATDPGSLTEFTQAHDYALSDQSITGLGFSLGREFGIIGGDLDGCIDAEGRLSELAVELISNLETYFEISPGGRGLRFFGYASLDKALINSRLGLEIYCEKRFVTITGNALEGTGFALEDIQGGIDHLVEKYGKKSPARLLAASPAKAGEIDEALARIDPDCGYDDWIRVGMALKSTGDEKDFDRFNDWSALGDKYSGVKECRHKWESFSVEGGINIGTLYWMAGIRGSIPGGINHMLKGFEPFSSGNRPLTDLGNAERFVGITRGNVRFVPGLDRWIVWSGERWKPIPNVFEITRYVTRSIYDEARHEEDDEKRQKIMTWGLKSQSKPRLDAMADLARQSREVLLEDAQLDAVPHLLGVANGTVDLRTGKLLASERGRYITKVTSADYDPKSLCPRWEDFVLEIMSGDRELAIFLQRLAGYALWGGNPEQVVVILYGTGSNGKSTFVSTLQRILGDYARQIDPASLMAARHASAGGPRDDLVRLYRARYAVAVESGDGDRLDESLIKTVSGGDVIYARGMYARRGIEFTPEFLLMLATNHRPVIRGTDYAIWRRLVLVPFERSFREHERDTHLTETLKDELPGILTWMVDGCRAWKRDGLAIPEKALMATDAYRSDMDVLGDWVDERCIRDPEAVTPVADLYRNYREWCEAEGGKAYSNQWFGRTLENKGFSSEKLKGLRCRRGIKLR